MITEPKVSVVVPFRDAEQFLEEAVDSVFAQTFRDWELLLVDDGSTDGSTDVARRYAAEHPDKVRSLEHDGHAARGISATRNLGWRHARGMWIACLDADDVWLPSKLAEQMAIAEAHPEAGMIVGAAEYWYSWSGRLEDDRRDLRVPLGAPLNRVIQPPQLLEWLYPLARGPAPCPAVFLVKRAVVEAVGGWEDAADNAYEDQYFLVKVYLTTPVFASSACWARYRRHDASAMDVTFSAGGYDATRRRFLEWFEGYLRQHNLVGTRAWRLLQRCLWKYRHPRLRHAVCWTRSVLRRLTGGQGI